MTLLRRVAFLVLLAPAAHAGSILDYIRDYDLNDYSLPHTHVQRDLTVVERRRARVGEQEATRAVLEDDVGLDHVDRCGHHC